MQGFGAEDVSGEAVARVLERETPMIRKNKELREAQRRSSLGMRGQRASSSLGRGEMSESKRHRDAGTSLQSRMVLTDVGIPHPTVESAMFWKHITPTLPEPDR
jgi:kinetochore protein Mis13/DSN1